MDNPYYAQFVGKYQIRFGYRISPKTILVNIKLKTFLFMIYAKLKFGNKTVTHWKRCNKLMRWCVDVLTRSIMSSSGKERLQNMWINFYKISSLKCVFHLMSHNTQAKLILLNEKCRREWDIRAAAKRVPPSGSLILRVY